MANSSFRTTPTISPIVSPIVVGYGPHTTESTRSFPSIEATSKVAWVGLTLTRTSAVASP
ncbi:MAG TPA: hypothetical protein VM492_08920 [Sumerlaeia bacterium]|nr:hypothetical protein [Sumerlaeia bacterium]